MASSLGVPLDEWQEQVLEAAMGERANGKWSSKYIGLSVPRQNGKSQIIVARALAGVLLFGEKKVIISAQSHDTAREVWQRIIDIVEANPWLESRVTGRINAISRESLTFDSGLDAKTIQLKARTLTGVRGFSADCLLLDEGQILGKSAWGSINPTVSARPNPQVWLFGTPPTNDDDPFAFGRIRDSALAHKARHTWVEWSASPDDDMDDPDVWAKANPAFGIRISREAVEDDRAAMDDDQFGRERLGMWSSAGGSPVIGDELWSLAEESGSTIVDRAAIAIDVAPDASSASLAFAGQRADGKWHVELVEQRNRADWLPLYISEFIKLNPHIRAVVVDVGSSASIIADDISQIGVKFTAPRAIDVGVACERFVSGITAGHVRHTGQTQLAAAVANGRKRKLSAGGGDLWAWNRKNFSTDITPLVAATLALWGAQNSEVTKPKRSRGRAVSRGTGRITSGRGRNG